MRMLICFLLLFLSAASAQAASPDLSLSASNIEFSKSELIAGDTVRIYAKVRNLGDIDVSAQVFFYQGPTLIGKSQIVSVLAQGGSDDVYIDYQIPDGQFNIKAVIQGQDPTDINPDNDVAVTPLYESIPDADRDGIIDTKDNCSSKINPEQENMDADAWGDACDPDKDGDGTPNSQDFNPDDPTIANPPTTKKPDQPQKSEQPPATTTTKPQPLAPSPFLPNPSSTKTLAQNDAATSPAPLVAGVQDENITTTQITTEGKALLAFKQKDWRTYEFEAVPAVGNAVGTFAWDFGDGATSVQKTVTHAFPKAGVYTVTLATVDNQGNITSQAQIFDVSFFHLQNPYVQATVGLLILIIVGLTVFIIRLRRGQV